MRTDQFDDSDPDWATEEVWEATPRGITIPASYSGKTWESCLAAMIGLVTRQLESDDPIAMQMKKTQGVAVGFVDGDLQVVWRE